ncbi:MAG: ABC transporter permease, partial [Chloroflexi bacterium]|nr:ABC transporter permease [Chloroflexota bacterium]
NQAGGDPFSDPLLFLVPALTILAVSLIVVRLFPLVMELLGWVAGHVLRALSVVLALRQLARVASQYTGALLLLVLTLSLATFTASMARTLDQSVVDQAYYKYGADFQFLDQGEAVQASPLETLDNQTTTTATGAVAAEEASSWAFVPVSEHLKAPSITGAARVGAYTAAGAGANSTARGTFYGIDRLEFPEVAWFRRDLASSSLGALMNRLALDRSALLVHDSFLRDYALRVGDRLDLNLVAHGERATVSFVIADAIRYFPTWYPEDTRPYCFVGNLDYVYERLGGVFPYQVWISTQQGTSRGQVVGELAELDIPVTFISGATEEIDAVRSRPERAGVFGILSVGFIAAALLTTLGFVLHSLISFRRRYIEFGVLRAIGLSLGQMISFLGLEQLLLIGTGVSAGTLLGVWVSRLFVPFLQVGTASHYDVPPFVVLIAWEDIGKIYLVFGSILVLAVMGMIYSLLRLKIFEAVKLGEAV